MTDDSALSPYLRAHASYHAHGEPRIPWRDVVDFHHQRGIILSTWDFFVMARPVPDECSPQEELSLCDFGLTGHHGGTWHIWSAAGDLRKMSILLEDYAIETLSFQRRGQSRLHRACPRRLFNLVHR